MTRSNRLAIKASGSSLSARSPDSLLQSAFVSELNRCPYLGVGPAFDLRPVPKAGEQHRALCDEVSGVLVGLGVDARPDCLFRLDNELIEGAHGAEVSHLSRNVSIKLLSSQWDR
jgi:hypothetical protein